MNDSSNYQFMQTPETSTTTMKAIVYQTYGLPEVLQMQEVGRPTPQEDEVLIKIHAASVNSWDWDLVTGKPLIYRLLFGVFKPKYPIIGSDVAGEVVAVGKNVTQFQAGDAVYGDISESGFGAFAEYVCASEKALALKPKNLTFEQAAAVPQAAILASQGLAQGQIQDGKTVLINGAAGGVGTFAIQMAKKLWNTEITAVDRADKLDLLKSLGADHVIDYKKEDYAKRGQQYDLILDVVANRSVLDHARALRPGGNFVLAGGAISTIFQTLTWGTWISKREGKKIGILVHRPNGDDLEDLRRIIEAGKLTPIIDKCYSLYQTADALQRIGDGEVQGKVVITIDQ